MRVEKRRGWGKAREKKELGGSGKSEIEDRKEFSAFTRKNSRTSE